MKFSLVSVFLAAATVVIAAPSVVTKRDPDNMDCRRVSRLTSREVCRKNGDEKTDCARTRLNNDFFPDEWCCPKGDGWEFELTLHQKMNLPFCLDFPDEIDD